MPPPVSRPGRASAARASFNDEMLRQKRVAENTGSSASSGSKAKVYGVPITRLGANNQIDFISQKRRDGPMVGRDIDRDERGLETYERYERGSRNYSMKSVQKTKDDPNKGGHLKGAAGTSSEQYSPAAKHQYETYHRSTILSDPYGYAVLTKSEEKHNRDNLDFYRNRIQSKPYPGHTIEDMLKWKGDYDMLDRNYQYIQWLFPIPDGNGLNSQAQQLFEHEAKAIRDDDLAHTRVLIAYKMMLDFYGMQLVNSVSGVVKRATKGWQERYDHLNRSRHNYSRITRILTSIGELGYERLQAPLVNFLIEEAVINGELPNLNGPCLMHWIMAVKDDGEREMLYRKASGLPIIQDYEMLAGDSESEGEDEKVDTNKLKHFDHHYKDMMRVTLDESKNHDTAQKFERDNHVDTASVTAMLEQAKYNERTQSSSKAMSEQKGRRQKETHVKTKTECYAMELPKDSDHVKVSSESSQSFKVQTLNEHDMKNKTQTTSSTITKDTKPLEAVPGSLSKQKDTNHDDSHIHENTKTYADGKWDNSDEIVSVEKRSKAPLACRVSDRGKNGGRTGTQFERGPVNYTVQF